MGTGNNTFHEGHSLHTAFWICSGHNILDTSPLGPDWKRGLCQDRLGMPHKVLGNPLSLVN